MYITASVFINDDEDGLERPAGAHLKRQKGELEGKGKTLTQSRRVRK